jgi:hypothetical protein
MWKHRLNNMASALTFSRTFEETSGGEQIDRAELRARARAVLDDRPLACF